MLYLFNGKELDSETNLTYYGARYLDIKTSLWLSTDPLSGYNPIIEHEHYIDGQHNGGVFNPMNLNTYTYTYQNPILYIDPNGKQGIPGILLGALTEYGSIIGEKMIFDNMSFIDANTSLEPKDYANIGISAGIGAISGTAKFGKFMSSSIGKRVMKEIGTSVMEGFIKLGTEILMKEKAMKQVEAEKIIVTTLVEIGLGKLLPTPTKKNLGQAEKAFKYYKKPKYWKAQQARNTRDVAEVLNTTGKALNQTIEKIGGKGSEKVLEKTRENDN